MLWSGANKSRARPFFYDPDPEDFLSLLIWRINTRYDTPLESTDVFYFMY